MPVDDAKIVKAFQNGQLDKFDQLYDKYVRKIYRFVYYKTFNREVTEDLVSQAFLKALENIGSFRKIKGTFQAWLYQIARNTVIDHYRKDRDEIDVDSIWDLESSDEVFKKIEQRELLEKVFKILNKIDTEKREILMLKIWDELSYKEISEITGKTEASLKMTVSRILKNIRQQDYLALIILGLIIKL